MVTPFKLKMHKKTLMMRKVFSKRHLYHEMYPNMGHSTLALMMKLYFSIKVAQHPD